MLEKLNAKLAEIRTQKERATANLNALVGAEQVLLQLIDETKAEENKKEKAEEVTADENTSD